MEKQERERESKKKKWTTPQLIVLVRGRSEEGVLFGCKGDTGGITGGPSLEASGCIQHIAFEECGHCHEANYS